MREVKRKRPWETQIEETDSHMLNTFFYQLILSTFIIIGIFMALNTDNNKEIKSFISRELTRSIQLEDIETFVSDVKFTVDQYMSE